MADQRLQRVMDAILQLLTDYRMVNDGLLRVEERQTETCYAVNPQQLQVEIAAGGSLRLVVLHDRCDTSDLSVYIGSGASCELVVLSRVATFADVQVKQEADSVCRVTSLQLDSSNTSYCFDLNGGNAQNNFDGLFVVANNEHSVLKLRTNHNVADCHSATYVKGVAGGCAVGEFGGLVYVAPDAQRTDAQQQNRNMLLGENARIDTKPQLEIYADDVKCSHGATVGQMDDEAILYMRQRGLSESLARRLQIEGFVAEVVNRCEFEALHEPLIDLIATKMEGI